MAKNISTTKFRVYLSSQSAKMRENESFGTARNYDRARDSFARFLKHEKIDDTVLDEHLICSYGNYLSGRGLVRNTISFYMRILRSAYNKAVSEGLGEQETPFKRVYTGVDVTRKRAVSEKTIKKLLKTDFDEDGKEFARDLFAFSFFTRGMAFVDMAYLKKKDVEGGIIHYTRKKTGQHLTIKAEPCIQSIIKKYIGSPGAYLFPLLRSESPSEAYRQYEAALAWYNKKLKKIADQTGINVSLSSYAARHSWATSARNHRVPLSLISAGMGHNSENTTRIYLASIDNSEIDKANRKVLSFFKDLR